MSLFEKLKKLYSEISLKDVSPFTGTIVIQNDSDGRGEYIAEWNHPTLAKPTQEQLDAVKEE